MTAGGAGGAAEAPRWRAGDYFDLGLIGATHGLSDGFSHLLVPVLALIVADLGLSTMEAGILLSVFGLAGFLFLYPISMVADYTGRKKTAMIVGLGLSASAFVAMGWTSSFFALAALAFVAGAGNSTYHPCGTALTAERFAASRAFAISWQGLGGNLGTSFMPLLQAALAVALGWRAAIVACAFPAAALLPLVGWRFPEGRKMREGGGTRTAFASLFSRVLRNRNVVLLAVTYTVRGLGMRGMIGFLPLIAARKVGMDTGSIGLAVSLYFAAGAVTKPVMGFLYSRMGARVALFVPLLLSGALTLAIGFTTWAAAFIVLSAITGVFSFVSPIVMTATADLCEREALASSVGFVYACEGLRFASPIVGGWLAERYGLEASYVFFALAVWTAAGTALLIRGGAPPREGS